MPHSVPFSDLHNRVASLFEEPFNFGPLAGSGDAAGVVRAPFSLPAPCRQPSYDLAPTDCISPKTSRFERSSDDLIKIDPPRQHINHFVEFEDHMSL